MELTRNYKTEDQVRTWLIQHYVANDVLFMMDARERVLGEHPELNDDENPQRKKLESLCATEKTIKWETKLFNGPHGPPDIDEAILYRPFQELYGDIICLMAQEVDKKGVNVNLDYDKMHSLWEEALAVALQVMHPIRYYQIFRPEEGKERLKNLYSRHQNIAISPKAIETEGESISKFRNYFLEAELGFLEQTMDTALLRIPDVQQRAVQYVQDRGWPERAERLEKDQIETFRKLEEIKSKLSKP